MKFSKSLLAVISIVVLISIAGVIFFFIQKQTTSDLRLQGRVSFLSLRPITIGNQKLYVEIAQTSEEKAQGLSGRESFKEDQGMLFIYDEAGFYSFWMKDMLFPIDIIWIDENFEIVDVTKNIQPDSFPQIFQSQKPAQYVLEVNAGFSDQNSIQIGDKADFSEIPSSKKFEELIFTEDSKNDEVIVLTKEGKIIKRIKVDHGPHDIALSPDNRFVVTANFRSNTISIINVQNLSLQKTIATGDGAHGVAFSPDGSFLFVANARENTLSIIETTTFTKQTKINVGDYPEYVGVTKDGSKIFTTNLGNGGSITLLKNDGFESKVIKEIASGIDPHGWALSPDGKKLVITNLGSNFAYLLDARTFEEISHINTGAATEFAVFKDESEFWVTNIGAHYVSIIDLEQNKVIDKIAVGETPHGIAFSEDKTLAFVPLYQPGELVIIEVRERKIVKRVKIGEELHNVVVMNQKR